jgi:hypothetical protein
MILIPRLSIGLNPCELSLFMRQLLLFSCTLTSRQQDDLKSIRKKPETPWSENPASIAKSSNGTAPRPLNSPDYR